MRLEQDVCSRYCFGGWSIALRDLGFESHALYHHEKRPLEGVFFRVVCGRFRCRGLFLPYSTSLKDALYILNRFSVHTKLM